MTTEQELRDKLEPLWAEGWPDIIAVGEGWFKIVSDLVDTLNAFGKPYTVAQVKEKFGGLRFYINEPDDKSIAEMMRARIYAAEARSLKTCDRCGRPAEQRRQHYWIYTVCDNCWERVDA